MNNRLKQIQVLRAIACLFVIIDHTKVPNTVGLGQFGVAIFFMISGFVMMLSTNRQDNTGMLLKRFIRIAPPYYVITLVTVVINLINTHVYTFKEYTDVSVYKIFTSLSFLAFLPNGLATIVNVGWTISIEMFFYLLFYVAYKISFKYRGVLTILGILILQVISSFTDVFNYDFAYGRHHMIYFALGIAMYHLYCEVKKECTIKNNQVINMLIMLLSVITISILSVYYHLDTANLKVFTGTFLIFALWIVFYENANFPKCLVWLGDRSYSVYLTHALTLQFCIQLVYKIEVWNPKNIIIFVGYLIFMILVGEIYYVLIEKKFTGVFMNIWKKSKT